MLLLDAHGAPLSHDQTLFVSPLPHGAQITAAVTVSPGPCTLIVPLRAGAAILGTGGAPARFLDAVIAVFPDVHVQPPPGGGGDVEDAAAAAAASDATAACPASPRVVRADSAHHHTHTNLYAEGAVLMSGEEVARGGGTAAALAAAYTPHGDWCFLVLRATAPGVTLAWAATSPRPSPSTLHVPLRAGGGTLSPLSTSASGECGVPPEAYVRLHAHVVSVGTQRRSDWAGGGKTPGEAFEDTRARFASGTFTVQSKPELEWGSLRRDAHLCPAPLLAAFAGASTSTTSLLEGGGGGEDESPVPSPPVVHEGGAEGLRKAVSFSVKSIGSSGRVHSFGRVPLLGVADTIRIRKVVAVPDCDWLLALDVGADEEEVMA